MKRLLGVVVVLSCWLSNAAAAEPRPKLVVEGLRGPHSVAVGADRRIYVTEFDGRVVVIQDGKAVTFATGLGSPRGLVAFQQWLFVADTKRVWRIDLKGKVTEFAAEKAFPTPPTALKGITV